MVAVGEAGACCPPAQKGLRACRAPMWQGGEGMPPAASCAGEEHLPPAGLPCLGGRAPLATCVAEIIASTNLIILLEDEIFADFFNTFLSLPVFGQMPFYTVENSQWSLWPEIPDNLITKYKGLLTWLEKYRLPFFCKTNLCFQYILCQELVNFIKSPEGVTMMQWKKADQWLLQKCIGGVRGMRRFCAYLKSSAGEELVDFWILTEKILSIDEMDLEMKDHYLSLLFMLKTTHLQEGSKVVTLCNMNIKSLLNLSIWHPNQSTTRREILSHMQKMALFKLQSYWLPNFYAHAKTNIAKEQKCQGLMQEFETRLCSVCYSHIGNLPLIMSIKKHHCPQKWYSSKKSKRKMWQLIDQSSWSLDMELPPISLRQDTTSMALQEMHPQKKVIKLSSITVSHSKDKIINSLKHDTCTRKSFTKKKNKSHMEMEGVFETKFTTHLRTVTPIINHSFQMKLKKAVKQSLSLGYTSWALCADTYAGNPFRDYLKKKNLTMETLLLDLWQDLHHFLNVLMSNRKNGNAVFRHMLGDRICKLYLNEQIESCLPLKSQTIQGLKKLLPLGDVNPWIPRAQKEICKVLSPWYNRFLDEEDYWFLIFTTQNRLTNIKWHKNKEETSSREESIRLCKRVQESLELSQGLANMEEMDSLQWQKIASEDLRQGGSLQVEVTSPVFLKDVTKMTFEELCYRNPKMAIERISDDYRVYCEKVPGIDFMVEIIKAPKTFEFAKRKWSCKKGGARKPSVRPRNLAEVLLNSQHLDYFKEFLRERKADNPLLFLLAIQKISVETNEKHQKCLLDNILKTFFHGKVSAEEALQCRAPIIKEISQMRQVSTSSLLTVQGCVMRCLEEKWFKDYQDLFPLQPSEGEAEARATPRKPSKTVQESQNRGWLKMFNFIKSFCRYRRCISDPIKRQEFENYLHTEIHNTKENFPSPANTSGRSVTVPPNARNAEQENGEPVLMKRRILGHKIIIVNFVVNDIYFFSEMERFNQLVSSAQVMHLNQAYTENDLILIRSKVSMIVKLYLQSEIPPKLRVLFLESKTSLLTVCEKERED
ncbi:PREDICTED: regulator of G-protein signaling protein-like [Elephantulus edwardii]|uniref:regulator of G-protein signaling protein-like n=1 Tax=Elephantulus edwardii TaxID=28737 RepID=UPI0003F07F94|nr:PREDICTED: regulator of G-protein signaling protein-like [Elephantulus edwardii]